MFSALVAAARLYYRKNPAVRDRMSAILNDLHREFGLRSRLFAAIGGRYLLRKVRKEERRLAAGWTYEPPTFYEKNYACEEGDGEGRTGSARCRFVTPGVLRPTTTAASPTSRLDPLPVG